MSLESTTNWRHLSTTNWLKWCHLTQQQTLTPVTRKISACSPLNMQKLLSNNKKKKDPMPNNCCSITNCRSIAAPGCHRLWLIEIILSLNLKGPNAHRRAINALNKKYKFDCEMMHVRLSDITGLIITVTVQLYTRNTFEIVFSEQVKIRLESKMRKGEKSLGWWRKRTATYMTARGHDGAVGHSFYCSVRSDH